MYPSEGDAEEEPEAVLHADKVPVPFEEAEVVPVAALLRDAEAHADTVPEPLPRGVAVEVAHAEEVKVGTAVEELVAAEVNVHVSDAEA